MVTDGVRACLVRGGMALAPAHAVPAKLALPSLLGTPRLAWPRDRTFVQRLRQLGWIEDALSRSSIAWAEGRSERWAEIAADSSGSRSCPCQREPRPSAGKQASRPFRRAHEGGRPFDMAASRRLARPGATSPPGDAVNRPCWQTNSPDFTSVIPVLRRWRSWPSRISLRRTEMAELADRGPQARIDAAVLKSGSQALHLPSRRFKGRADALYVVGDALEPPPHPNHSLASPATGRRSRGSAKFAEREV